MVWYYKNEQIVENKIWDIIACKDDEDCFGFGIEWREE